MAAPSAVEPDTKEDKKNSVAPDAKADKKIAPAAGLPNAAEIHIPAAKPAKRKPLMRKRTGHARRGHRGPVYKEIQEEEEEEQDAPDEVMFTSMEAVLWCAYREPDDGQHHVYRVEGTDPNCFVPISNVA